MTDFSDALGLDSLPPSPVYPIDQLIAPSGGTLSPPPIDPNALIGAGSSGDRAGAMGLNVPVAPPSSPGAPMPISPPAQPGGGTGINLQQILGLLRPQQQSGFSVPNFMASLGAGLSSAGQNWNKPAAAAFASGAGAAIQGGQQVQQQQQDARLKALQAAIAAWKVGDLAAYHQAIVNLRAALAPQRAAAPSAPAPSPAPAPAANVTGSPFGPAIDGRPATSAGAAPPSATLVTGGAPTASADVMA